MVDTPLNPTQPNQIISFELVLNTKSEIGITSFYKLVATFIENN